ncbi:MAG TPA: hypothetical protein VFE19_05025 [Jatrophihabitantaceae bacterium]|jgi:hypothetical protein|nr:hypothetical protein [Jatrophihabitantaceae bacterium]
MAEQSTQQPQELQQDTTHESAPPSGPPLTEQQRKMLFRLLRVAYPHDRFPDAPYERTAKQVEDAAEDIAALAEGLDALGEEFLAMDEAAATDALRAIDEQAFFRAIHSTTVVALYDDREVWDLLGYEGSSFDKGGYLERGFDDLDWLPDPRITESEESRVELVTDEGTR